MKLFNRTKQETRSASELFDEVRELTRRNREQRDPELDRRILWLRHLAGAELIREEGGDPEFVEPDFAAVRSDAQVIEIGPEELTPSLLRAAILSRGCLLVRGLVDRGEAIGRPRRSKPRIRSAPRTGRAVTALSTRSSIRSRS